MTTQANGYGGVNVVGVMITNNAVGHPPSTYAKATADKIVIDPWPQDDPTGEKLQAARLLRARAQIVFEGHHQRISIGANFQKCADHALVDFLDLTRGTILENHYANPLVQDLIRLELGHEFGSQFQFIAANQKQ